MEKCRYENNFCLPEDIIQHIQSFLSSKEAAQTSVLSKPWHTAWLTRYNLVFDQHDFERNDEGYWEFVDKTLQRYVDLNLRIQSLRVVRPFHGHYNFFLVDKLIGRAMKLGATDFNFELTQWSLACVLPREVFASKTLTRLSVTGGKIELGEDRKASCSRLKSLSLRKVYMEGDIIWYIMSSCPLIEKLSVSECLVAPSKDDPYMLPRPFDKLSGSDVNRLMKGFSKLKCVFLERVHIDTSFFVNFSSKFPCLKDLSVHNCDVGYDGIRIDSSSLECISFVQDTITMLSAEFDVPCIRKFVCNVCSLPSLSFKEYSRGCKLYISLYIIRFLRASWFFKLKRVLAKLCRFEISLSLRIFNFWDSCGSILKSWDDDQGSPVAVEDLMLKVRASISSPLLDGLFWSCHPKLITLQLYTCNWERKNDCVELLCMKLIRKVSIIPNGSSLGLHDLEKVVSAEVFNESLALWQPIPLLGCSKVVSAEVLDESLAEWQPLLSKILLGASMGSEYKLRFKLRWE